MLLFSRGVRPSKTWALARAGSSDQESGRRGDGRGPPMTSTPRGGGLSQQAEGMGGREGGGSEGEKDSSGEELTHSRE
jgi:hypothetical protein